MSDRGMAGPRAASDVSPTTRLPSWLKAGLPGGENFERIRSVSARRGLHTVCSEARCPNIAECWGSGTATFMVLGDSCTRGCRFCSVASSSRPPASDPEEPERLALTLSEMGLDYAVITTVCRDDLPDQGSGHIARCLRAVKARCPGLKLELLAQDFRGEEEPLAAVLSAGPDVLAHNLETVERLTPRVRDAKAGYAQSLGVMKTCKKLRPATLSKSSLMLGLGETEAELLRSFKDLRGAGVDVLTLGQYLRPTRSARHLPVSEFVPPERFELLGELARSLGFLYVAAGPLVRSSYKAGEAFLRARLLDSQAFPPKTPAMLRGSP